MKTIGISSTREKNNRELPGRGINSLVLFPSAALCEHAKYTEFWVPCYSTKPEQAPRKDEDRYFQSQSFILFMGIQETTDSRNEEGKKKGDKDDRQTADRHFHI